MAQRDADTNPLKRLAMSFLAGVTANAHSAGVTANANSAGVVDWAKAVIIGVLTFLAAALGLTVSTARITQDEAAKQTVFDNEAHFRAEKDDNGKTVKVYHSASGRYAGAGVVMARVERFDRRGTEPFEPFEPCKFFQNSEKFTGKLKISEI